MPKDSLNSHLHRLVSGKPQSANQRTLSFVSGPSKASLQARKQTQTALGTCLKLTPSFIKPFRLAHYLYLLQSPTDSVEGLLQETSDTGNGHPPMVLYTGLRRWPVMRRDKNRPLFESREEFGRYADAVSRLHKVMSAGMEVMKTKDKAKCIGVVKPLAEEAAKELKDLAVRKAAENVLDIDEEQPPNTTIIDVDTLEPECIDLDSDKEDDHPSDAESLFSFEIPDPWPQYTTGPLCNGCGVDHSQLTACSNIFRASYVNRLVLVEAVSHIETAKEYPLAVEYLRLILLCPFFKARRRGRFWQRLVINSTHLKDGAGSVGYLQRSLTEEESRFMAGGDRLWLQRRFVKVGKGTVGAEGVFSTVVSPPEVRYVVGKKWKGSRWPCWDLDSSRVVADEWDMGGVPVEPFKDKPPSLGNVEKTATAAICRHLGEGWEGVHCEGSTLRFIFTLLMWDVLFDTAEDTNLPSRFLSAPVDFGSPFFSRRKDAIEARCNVLRNMPSPDLLTALSTAYTTHTSVTAFNCDWTIPPETLLQITSCLGPTRTSLLCHDFATSMQLSGLPDLLLWNPLTNEILLSEVKGPGDTLSTKQELWLTHLSEMGIPCEVCRVLDVETLHAKKQKRASVGSNNGSEKGAKRRKKGKEEETPGP
eukprot:TRINITY_DN14501_c0_g1_i1.p1 TRINITY_DN14501_c0_g1~~TRINITY_DN14501_c0_g1_i1.p1  ORF type:complete len:646 (+),score=142.90 TRINITY_DN14501_c0_g1_i1:492-2429(+)